MTGIPNLIDDNGMEYTTSLTKAHALNKQFSSVFSKVTPTTLKDTASYLIPPLYNPMDCITITTAGISKLLCKLDSRKAPGPDNISPRVLKELYFSIAPTLQVIYERSYNDGVVPYDWLHANVCPIYKKGTRKAPVNYRPISLTCIACKLFEHIVTSSVMSHLDNQKILLDNQHGFRRGRSCETQLTELTHDLLTSMHNGIQTDMIVMDFSKAFDKVAHNKLISSLHGYGIDSTTLEWIRSFLSGRTQSVVVDGAESDTLPVTSGVPQGSVLGPAMFLVYINSLPKGVNSTVRLFADDTVIYREISSEEDHHTVQADLDTLVQWEREFSMEFHPKKCNILRVTRSRCPSMYNYTLHGTTLKELEEVKYLGITITKDLSWEKHIHNITSKANSQLGFIRRNVRTRSMKTREKLYNTLVRPHLEYAASVWDPHVTKHKQAIEKVQRRAARWVTNQHDSMSSVTAMLQELDWQPLELRRAHSRLGLLYQITNGIVATPHIPYLLSHIHAPRSSRHANTLQHATYQCRTNYFKYSYFPHTVVLWNSLPQAVVSSPTLEAFKTSLRRCRMPQIYNSDNVRGDIVITL